MQSEDNDQSYRDRFKPDRFNLAPNSKINLIDSIFAGLIIAGTLDITKVDPMEEYPE